MVKTTRILAEELAAYGAPKNKISRMVNSGQLLRVVNGLYETDSEAPPVCLAASIYGPSYVSFQYALAFHDLIPEDVPVITSATFGKGKAKRYVTPFGTFTFHDIPKAAFPYGIELHELQGRPFRIASLTKAVCDTLWLMPPANNYRELEEALYENLRLDASAITRISSADVRFLAERYRSTTIRKLADYLERRIPR